MRKGIRNNAVSDLTGPEMMKPVLLAAAASKNAADATENPCRHEQLHHSHCSIL